MEQRTEQATARKLARARTHGAVARSPELSVAAALLAVAGVLVLSGGQLFAALRALVVTALAAAAGPLDAVDPFAPLAVALRDVAVALALVLLAAAAAAWLAGFAQVGPLFAGAAVAPDVRRLSPAERLRALLSGERAGEVAFGALKLGILLTVGLCALVPSLRALASLPQGGVVRAQAVLSGALLDVAVRMGAALALLGIADLVVRRVRHARAQRMSRRELADEQREAYGLPEHRAERGRRYQEARVQAELGGLERASVLLLDAEGRAVALAFDAADLAQRAPRLSAKGQGQVALRMQAHALQHGLPCERRGALVAALFRLELSETIRDEHVAEVAEVFAALPALPARAS